MDDEGRGYVDIGEDDYWNAREEEEGGDEEAEAAQAGDAKKGKKGGASGPGAGAEDHCPAKCHCETQGIMH